MFRTLIIAFYTALTLLSAKPERAAAANPAGDANNDGLVNLADAALLQSALYGTVTAENISPLALTGTDATLSLDDLLFGGQAATGARTGLTPPPGMLTISVPPVPLEVASEQTPNPVISFAVVSAYPGAGDVNGLEIGGFAILESLESTLTNPDTTVAANIADVELVPFNTTGTDDSVTVRLTVPMHDSDGNPLTPLTADFSVIVHPAVCGDGIIQSGELCDDGNTNPGDGCDADCNLECTPLACPPVPGSETVTVSETGLANVAANGWTTLNNGVFNGDSVVRGIGTSAVYTGEFEIQSSTVEVYVWMLGLVPVSGGAAHTELLIDGNPVGQFDGTPSGNPNHIEWQNLTAGTPITLTAGTHALGARPVTGTSYAYFDGVVLTSDPTYDPAADPGLLPISGTTIDLDDPAHDEYTPGLASCCGDCNLDPGEVCDLGLLNGDPTVCCDAACQFLPADTECDTDSLFCTLDTCSGADEVCRPTGYSTPVDDGVICTDDSCDEVADSIVNTPNDTLCDNGLFCDGAETCDPLNGCQLGTAPTCDDADPCTADSCNPATDACENLCAPTCGDGMLCTCSEACDDGDTDPCTVTCNADCTGPYSVVCGDGIAECGETCDDGDTDPCTVTCNADCTGPYTVVCGDGIAECGETCDDGDTDPCTAACNADCSGPAANLCGDGLVECGEYCDDGNTVSCDGCAADCLTPEGCGDGIINCGEQCDETPLPPVLPSIGSFYHNDDWLYSYGPIRPLSIFENRLYASIMIYSSDNAVFDISAPGIWSYPISTQFNYSFRIHESNGYAFVVGGIDTSSFSLSAYEIDNNYSAMYYTTLNESYVDARGFLDRLYIVTSPNSLKVFQIDSYLPLLIVDYPLPGEPKEIAVAGNENVLVTLDTNPDSLWNYDVVSGTPIPLGNVNIPESAENLVASKSLALLNDGAYLRIYQHNSGPPVFSDSFDTGADDILEMILRGPRLFVYGQYDEQVRLLIYDLTGPTPDLLYSEVVGSISHIEFDPTWGMYFYVLGPVLGDDEIVIGAGEMEYIGAGYSAISSLSSRSIVEQCTLTCQQNVCGDYVLQIGEACDDGNTIDCDGCSADCTMIDMTCGNGILECTEACDDGNRLSGDGCRPDCRGIELCGDGLFDIGEICDDGNSIGGDGCRADCAGTEVCGDGLLDIGEVCDDGPPTFPIINSRDTPDGAYSIAIAGHWAYIADRSSGLLVIDISDPTFPIIASRDTPGYALGIAIAGDRAYIADQSSGLQVIDISDPTYPITGSRDTPSYAMGVAISGDRAYIANYTSGLQVIDISDPALPIVGSRDMPGDALGIAIAGDRAYIADNSFGLQVIDISDPAFPIIGSRDTPGQANAIAVSGVRAFIADYESGLQVIDIADPAFPIIGFRDTPSNARGITISGNRAYIANYTSGLQVIDIADPALPIIGSCDTPGYARGVAIAGNRAYIADRYSGLQVIDITETCGAGCTLPTCGDGVVNPGEACDDGNTLDCDGCLGDCSDLDNICGDGILECGETCDDGNIVAGDGCNPFCSGP